jgi:hypothetical protein
MRNISLLLVALSTLIGASRGRAQSQEAPIVGAWKILDSTLYIPGPGASWRPRGESMFIYTAGGHFSLMELDTPDPRPTAPLDSTTTVAQLRAVWGPFFANAGTYRIAGDTLTHWPTVSRNPGGMLPGAFTSYTVRMIGTDTLIFTPIRNRNGAIPNPLSGRLVRIE